MRTVAVPRDTWQAVLDLVRYWRECGEYLYGVEADLDSRIDPGLLDGLDYAEHAPGGNV